MSTSASRTATFLAVGATALAATLGGCVVSDAGDASLTVYNESSFVIEEIYLTEVNSPTWGRDLLGNDVLYPGESLALGVDCAYYDALLIDETGAECEIPDLDLCFNDAQWVIRNNSCDVFSAAARARAAEAAARGTGAEASVAAP